jgi:hypothetical protein
MGHAFQLYFPFRMSILHTFSPFQGLDKNPPIAPKTVQSPSIYPCHPERVIKLLYPIVLIADNVAAFGCVGTVQASRAIFSQFSLLQIPWARGTGSAKLSSWSAPNSFGWRLDLASVNPKASRLVRKAIKQ